MKKTTRIVAILIALTMALGMMAACEGSSGQQTSPSSTDSGSGASGGGAALPGGKDVYNDPIKISVISISTLGQVNRMYQMALNDQRVRYPNVQIDFKDAEYDPNRQITLIE